METYKSIKSSHQTILSLKSRKLLNFNDKLAQFREVLEIIEKPSINLITSEPFGNKHGMDSDKRYVLTVDSNNVRFIDGNGSTFIIDDSYVKQTSWFQVFVYIDEMENEMEKIYNHILNSKNIDNDYINNSNIKN